MEERHRSKSLTYTDTEAQRVLVSAQPDDGEKIELRISVR